MGSSPCEWGLAFFCSPPSAEASSSSSFSPSSSSSSSSVLRGGSGCRGAKNSLALFRLGRLDLGGEE